MENPATLALRTASNRSNGRSGASCKLNWRSSWRPRPYWGTATREVNQKECTSTKAQHRSCVCLCLCIFVCVCVYVRVCSSVYACVTYGGVSSTYIKPNVSSKREKENPNEEIKLGTWKNLFATWRNWWRHLRFQLPVLNITVIALCQSKQLKQTKPQPLNKKLLNLPTLPD